MLPIEADATYQGYLRAYRLWSHDFELITTRETTELEDLGGEVRFDYLRLMHHTHTRKPTVCHPTLPRVILKVIHTKVG